VCRKNPRDPTRGSAKRRRRGRNRQGVAKKAKAVCLKKSGLNTHREGRKRRGERKRKPLAGGICSGAVSIQIPDLKGSNEGTARLQKKHSLFVGKFKGKEEKNQIWGKRHRVPTNTATSDVKKVSIER